MTTITAADILMLEDTMASHRARILELTLDILALRQRLGLLASIPVAGMKELNRELDNLAVQYDLLVEVRDGFLRIVSSKENVKTKKFIHPFTFLQKGWTRYGIEAGSTGCTQCI